MPRKRKVKITESKKAKPTLPEGNEGHQLTKKERREKLDMLLADFENEVELRIASYRSSIHQACHDIDNYCRLSLMTIPSQMRNVPLSELISSHECSTSFLEPDTEKVIQQSEVLAAKSTSGGRSKRVEAVCNENVPATKPRGRPKKASIKAGNSAMPPPGTKRKATRSSLKASQASNFETPGFHLRPGQPGAETPLITPAFDRRLPKTPFLRKAIPGERLTSLAGSPVSNHMPGYVPTNPELYLPIGSDKVLEITSATNLDDIEIDTEQATQVAEAIKKIQLRLNAVSQKCLMASLVPPNGADVV